MAETKRKRSKRETDSRSKFVTTYDSIANDINNMSKEVKDYFTITENPNYITNNRERIKEMLVGISSKCLQLRKEMIEKELPF